MIACDKRFTDAEIVNGLRLNNEVITSHFYITTVNIIGKFVRNNSGNLQDSKDICHDAILIFLNSIRDEDFIIEHSVSKYIYIIARNIWFNQLKRRKHIIPNIKDLDGFQDTTINIEMDSEWVRVEKNKLFWKYFAILKEDCRQILSLSFKNYSDEHIAEALGVHDKSMIIKRKSRCKNYLIQSVRTDPIYNDLFCYE